MDYGRGELYETFPENDFRMTINLTQKSNRKLISFDIFRNLWLELDYNQISKTIKIVLIELLRGSLQYN